jgi:DNA polymerase III alpha subunit (gram-positive type)
MRVCGIDFEATSVDPKEARIIEVGAAVWDTVLQTPVALLSEFVDPMIEIPEEITKITGITNGMVEEYGKSEAAVLTQLEALIDVSDYCMAHNGTIYDVPLWRTTLKRYGKQDETTLWLDSRTDIKFPGNITTRNLRHLAVEHDFCPNFPHRAVFDVLTMFKIASRYDWDAIIARAKEPVVIVQANVTYQENQKAKDFSFRWNPQQKIWWKEQKASDFAEEKDQYKFNISYLTERPVEVQ